MIQFQNMSNMYIKQDIEMVCILFLLTAATVDDAVSGDDSTVSSISAASLSSECKHKNVPRCFNKSKVRFCVLGCWGGEMRSLQTDITYGVNTEN